MFEALPGLAAIFYNRVPAQALQGFYRQVTGEIVREITSGKILDVGTGPGYLPIEIARANSSLAIIGIDLSPKMVQIARENAKKENVLNVEFKVADANRLPFSNNSFDFVISTAALHHWHNMKGVFNQINRVVKKNGIVWIYDLRRDAEKDEIRKSLQRNHPGYMRWAFKFHGLKTDQYFNKIGSLLEGTGAKIEKKDAFMRISWKKKEN